MLDAAGTLPTRRDVAEAVGLLACVGLAAGVIGFGTGLFTLAPQTGAGPILRITAAALFVPALAEELVFRVGLHPQAGARSWAIRAFAALALFVAWHPLQFVLGAPWATAAFLDPRFLFLAALLGAACAMSYQRSRSLWPPVLIHWLAVVGWKVSTGGAPVV